jgi:hypothetical protein
MTIVGVAGDVRDNGLAAPPAATLYVPYLQNNTVTARVSLVVKTQRDPRRFAASVRQAVWQADPNQPISGVAPLEDVLLEGASAERFRALLVVLFAGAGVLLAVVGIYAMTAAAVTSRIWEASLRLALGARPWRIAASVIGDASIQIFAGLALGLAGFWTVRRLISGLLFHTSPTEPAVMAASIAGLTLLALSAAALQARRLSRVSPALVLTQPG